MLRRLVWHRNYAMGRLEGYDFDRKNNTGFKPAKELFLQDMQPSWDLFITPESWLAFEMLGHSKGQVKWMLYPPEHWDIDPDYQEFVKNIAVYINCIISIICTVLRTFDPVDSCNHSTHLWPNVDLFRGRPLGWI